MGRKILILTVVILSVGVAGIASAAVSGNFTAAYDGYGDSDSTKIKGNEIAIQGQMEVTGDPAVNPVIVIKAGASTVLDTKSVEIFVEGDRSIQFERRYEAGEVRLVADEIPSGTTIRVEFNTYYIGSAKSTTTTAGIVQFNYDRPGGDRTRKTFKPDVKLENRPEQFVQAANLSAQADLAQRVLSYIGAGGLLILSIVVILKALGGSGPPGSKGPGPSN